MNEKEKALYNSIVHGLRRQGWGRFEAEDEAMYRIKTREYQAAVQKENATKARALTNKESTDD